MADIAASVLAKLKNKAKDTGISYHDVIYKGWITPPKITS